MPGVKTPCHWCPHQGSSSSDYDKTGRICTEGRRQEYLPDAIGALIKVILVRTWTPDHEKKNLPY